MFSDEAEVRRSARNFLEGCEPRPPASLMSRPEIFSKLSTDGTFHRWMVEELAKSNVCALENWSVVIRLCGSLIHTNGSGTSVLNNLLQVRRDFKMSNSSLLQLIGVST